jgi:nucleoside-diphosphate-sugar epimerase
VAWVAGDAMRQAEVAVAAEGAGVVFHGPNPPGYTNWRGLAIPMLRSAIAAARAAGARLIYPGSVYNYGPDAGEVVSEAAPQNPRTRKGRIRVEMEAMLRDAAAQGLRTLVVRAGDFFGPRAPSPHFSREA